VAKRDRPAVVSGDSIAAAPDHLVAAASADRIAAVRVVEPARQVASAARIAAALAATEEVHAADFDRAVTAAVHAADIDRVATVVVEHDRLAALALAETAADIARVVTVVVHAADIARVAAAVVEHDRRPDIVRAVASAVVIAVAAMVPEPVATTSAVAIVAAAAVAVHAAAPEPVAPVAIAVVPVVNAVAIAPSRAVVMRAVETSGAASVIDLVRVHAVVAVARVVLDPLVVAVPDLVLAVPGLALVLRAARDLAQMAAAVVAAPVVEARVRAVRRVDLGRHAAASVSCAFTLPRIKSAESSGCVASGCVAHGLVLAAAC
jgi:hypothetical protein